MSRKILVLMHLNGNFFFEKLITYFENCGSLSHYSHLIYLSNETMAINKFQRSRLTFDLLA